MDVLKKGWFSEISGLWSGQSFSMEVEKILHQEKSKYQDILVLQTKSYGKVLVLDGVIQCTEQDEFSYQEMISFLPLASHPNPKNVLVIGGPILEDLEPKYLEKTKKSIHAIGGGDGGVAREVSKFPSVETIIQCEIDDRVIDVSKQFLPFMASGYDSPKLTLHVGDGFEFMGQHQNEFDVIITDSSDPIGPAESLFQENYYRLVAAALRPGGIVCAQGENMWYHRNLISGMMKFCSEIFPTVNYAYTCIPTYPGGQIGFLLCSKDPTSKLDKPIRTFTDQELQEMNMRYYSSAMHTAAFVLPRFVKTALAPMNLNGDNTILKNNEQTAVTTPKHTQS